MENMIGVDMTRKRSNPWRMLLAVLAILAFIAAACGDDDSGPAADAGDETAPKKIGLIMGGPSNDNGFYEAGFNGSQSATADFGVEITIVENVTPPEGAQAFRDLVDAGNELVIGMGADFEDAGLTVAPEFPDTQFVVMNGRTTLPNLATYQLREAQSAFLGMYVVALLRPDATVGMVGGIEIPPHITVAEALEVGIAKAGSSSEVLLAFTGDFNDVALARAAAAAQISNGATIIVPWSGSAVEGAFAAAEEGGAEVMAALVDKCGQADYFIVSAVTDPGGLVYRVIEDFQDPDHAPDTSKALGLEDELVGRVVPCTALDTDNQELFDNMKQGLIDGTVEGLPQGV